MTVLMWLGLGLVGLVVVLLSVVVVPAGHARNVERLGKYQRTLGSGFHPIVPALDRALPAIDLRERVVTMPDLQLPALDGSLVATVRIRLRVVDAAVFAYSVSDPLGSVRRSIESRLRAHAGTLSAQDARTRLPAAAKQILAESNDDARTLGLEVTGIEVTDLRSSSGSFLSARDEPSAQSYYGERASSTTALGIENYPDVSRVSPRLSITAAAVWGVVTLLTIPWGISVLQYHWLDHFDRTDPTGLLLFIPVVCAIETVLHLQRYLRDRSVWDRLDPKPPRLPLWWLLPTTRTFNSHL